MVDRRSQPEPRLTLLIVWLVLGTAVFCIAGVYFIGRINLDGPAGTACRITAAGEQYRRSSPVETDQRPKGIEGESYTSTSGCVPFDEGAE